MDNPTDFGVDASRVCIAGISGGAWIVAGAANLLVKSGKMHRVKAVFIHTGMLSDETQNVPESELEVYERDWGQHARILTSVYKLHATDFDNQKTDDQLYPGKASDQILREYPPTVIWTSEFDMYRRDNE